MERENKYLVVKNADIEKHLSEEQQDQLTNLLAKIRVGRAHEGKGDQSYVIVAADWPMYETVWGMIEAYVERGEGCETDKKTEPAINLGQTIYNNTIEQLRADLAAAHRARKEWK